MQDVPDLNKGQWPEHITNALGIPAIQGRGGAWQSTEDTINAAWFHAMCDFLGIEYPRERIRAMQAILEAAGGIWDQARHSSAGPGKQPGGNVRREAFEDLWSALHRFGFIDADGLPSLAADALALQSKGQARPQFAYRHIRLRQGQPGFRQRLLQAYDGRCAVTQSDVVDTLEAAHIVPHAAGGGTQTSNGLLLRSDVHTLFDLGLVAVDTSLWRTLAHPTVRRSRDGSGLHHRRLHLPATEPDRPSIHALDLHRQRSGL